MQFDRSNLKMGTVAALSLLTTLGLAGYSIITTDKKAEERKSETNDRLFRLMSDVNAIADLDVQLAISQKDQEPHVDASNLKVEIIKIENFYPKQAKVPDAPCFSVPDNYDGRLVFLRQQQGMIKNLRDRIGHERGMQREALLPPLLVELRLRIGAFEEAYSKEVPAPISVFGLPVFVPRKSK